MIYVRFRDAVAALKWSTIATHPVLFVRYFVQDATNRWVYWRNRIRGYRGLPPISWKCPFDPTKETYHSLGMFHCPNEWCGDMVLAGMPHPDYSVMDDPNWIGWKELEESNRRQAEGRFDPDDGPDDIGIDFNGFLF